MMTERERRLLFFRPWARRVWPLMVPLLICLFPLCMVGHMCMSLPEAWRDWRTEFSEALGVWFA